MNGEVRGTFLKKYVGQGKKVLDIGCRDGALTKFYAQGNDVTGMDIDSSALVRASESLGIKTIHSDLNDIWALEETFDIVVACEIIEHVYYPEKVLKKIYEALKPGGILLGSIPHAFSLQSRLRLLFASKKNTALEDPTHINHFSGKEFKRLLEEAHFDDIYIEDILSKKFTLPAKVFPRHFAHSFMFKAHRPNP